jgi:putative nucleotidyltransferase with HDIG domain
MKKRILFVDDEALVLDGLRRMLRPMREEWEMVFAASGSEALELMNQAPFDVVVSDMRMPRMNGAELLAEVLKRFPQTVRLILSGHADKDLILKCVGSTHQYLAKPCRPEDLKAAIARAGELTSSLKDKGLRHLISSMRQVPSMPRLYIQMVEKLEDPEVGLDVIGDIIAKDLGMTSKILNLVNSSFFGLAREISSPAEAVSQVGAEMIKSLVLSVHAFSQFEPGALAGFSIDELWGHSQSTANLAQAIARMEDADQKIVDEAFVGGLLHDIGKLVLAANFPEEYKRVRETGRTGARSFLGAEENAFGANHADIGGYLLGLWGLPVPVVEAIALHHTPMQCTYKAFSPLTAIHTANALVNFPGPPDRLLDIPELDKSYLKSLGLDERLQPWSTMASSSHTQH